MLSLNEVEHPNDTCVEGSGWIQEHIALENGWATPKIFTFLLGLVNPQHLSGLTGPKAGAQAVHATLSCLCLTFRGGHCEEGVHTSALQLQAGQNPKIL